MAHVELEIEGGAKLECRSVVGVERLGEDTRFDVTAFAAAGVALADLLGKGCALELAGAYGRRVVQGRVARATAVATAHASPHRSYKLEVRASTFVLSLRRRTKVFQNLTVPKIVEAVLLAAGIAAKQIDVTRASGTPSRPYIVQLDETDASFVRRLCEEEGLYHRFESRDGVETFVLEWTSTTAPDAPTSTLTLVEESGLEGDGAAAWACEVDRKIVTGAVTVRGYDVEHPAVKLEGKEAAGLAIESALERYVSPARLTAPGEEATRAKRLLEAERALATVVRFRTNALDLAPGTLFDLTPAHDFAGLAAPDGKHLVVGLRHAWSSDDKEYKLDVEAVPASVPFRLPVVTPRPNAHGVHSATVTGSGGEVHTDKLARVTVRFPWDREGPTDHNSSLPIRVAQPNTPGSMLHPRVGWEAYLLFEDGDPDRPVVVGRAYNGTQRPPYALPGNKTMTAFESSTSPGGGSNNSVKFDDAAGRQNVAFEAAKDLVSKIANNLQRNVGNNEQLLIKGMQDWTIGGTQSIGVTSEINFVVDSEIGTVGGKQTIDVAKGEKVLVGGEIVLVGGAQLEKIGSIATGLKNVAIAAGASVPGWIGGAKVALALGSIGKVGKAGWDFYNAYSKASASGKSTASAWAGLGASVLGVAGEVAGIPGTEGITQAIDQGGDIVAEHQDEEAEKAHKAAEGQEHGGGAKEAKATGAAESPGGAGKRDTMVKGAMMETIGGAYTVTTPGSSTWSTGGYSRINVGGSHVTRALKYESKAAVSMTTTAGALYITAKLGDIVRDVKGPVTTTVNGALKYDAGLSIVLESKTNTTFHADGAMDLKAEKAVFAVGDSKVCVSSSGLTIESTEVVHNGTSLAKDVGTHK